MVTTASSQSPDITPASCLRLDTIPTEIRAIIYTYVCNPICLEVDSSNKLITTEYPWQLSAVSHTIRDEFLPTLLGKSTTQPLHLICQDGRFPDDIRRRIPNRVLYGINSITICGSLKYDELKVSPATFPNLHELWLHFPLLSFPLALAKLWEQDFPKEATSKFIQTVKRRILFEADKLKRELEMPREGLEKDYIVDGTLCEVLETRRERRGFDVKVLLTLSFVNKRDSGILMIDSWDTETCTSLV